MTSCISRQWVWTRLPLYMCMCLCTCVCVLQIAELKHAIAVGRKKVKERRAVEEQLVQKQIEVHRYFTTCRGRGEGGGGRGEGGGGRGEGGGYGTHALRMYLQHYKPKNGTHTANIHMYMYTPVSIPFSFPSSPISPPCHPYKYTLFHTACLPISPKNVLAYHTCFQPSFLYLIFSQ